MKIQFVEEKGYCYCMLPNGQHVYAKTRGQMKDMFLATGYEMPDSSSKVSYTTNKDNNNN